MKILSALLTFGCLAVWYLTSSEAEPWSLKPGIQESSRFRTLRTIATAANQGYYFQLEPGIPMENHWEDPGTGFLMVCWGLMKRALGLGPLDILKDPYRVEFFVILVPLFLLFFTRLFSLPRWYWLIVPLFFLAGAIPFYKAGEFGMTKTSGLLILSISARWAKTPAAFWIFTATIQFFEWWKDGGLSKLKGEKFLTAVVIGAVLGIFIGIRKDILISSGLSLAGTLALLAGRSKKAGVALSLLAVIFCGTLIFREAINLSWKIRDRVYPMKDFPRVYGHPVWHTLYAALGRLGPDKTIRWGDEDAWNDLSSLPENKGIRYGSKEHERAARKLYFETLAKYPRSFALGLVRKAAILVKGSWKLLALNFLLFVFLFHRFAEHRRLLLILLINALAAAVVPVLVIPDIIYSYDFRAHNYLALIIGLGMLLGVGGDRP